MIFNCFKDKMPVLGANIVILHAQSDLIAICEFTLEMKRIITASHDNYGYQLDYFGDDPEDDRSYDVRLEDFWIYPSQIKDYVKNQKTKTLDRREK